MPDKLESTKPFDFRKLIELAYLIVILSAFSWAKEFLLPIVLAILISFLLTPIVSRIERWGFHPVLAVLGVVIVAFALIGVLCTTVSVEALNLVNSLPKYRDNIHAKWSAIQQAPPGPVSLALRNIGELAGDLGKVTAPSTGAEQPEPTRVQIVSGADTIVAIAKNSMTPVMGPVAAFAVVVVLVVFILLERKQLRVRFLRLIGHSHTATTTLAVDEAGSRLSSFLLMQLAVNSVYSVVLGIGLSLIGIPNAVLWATLTLVLRFVPYVGLWISAFFPLALSFAISTSWTQPILTLLLYGILEVFTNNVIEPVVLGGSTGMSPLAVIIAALFWTWIWGPIGLLLATPITACLVALGRYFPAFHPYSIMLAADPPTSTEMKLIRLLTENRLSEAKALIHEVTSIETPIKAAEELIIPTVRAIENELFPGATHARTKSRIYEQMRELIEELNVPEPIDPKEVPEQLGIGDSAPVIVPLLCEGDEVVGRVLSHLLVGERIGESTMISWKTLRTEKVERLKSLAARCVVLSAIQPRSAMVAGNTAKSIRLALPDAVIVVCLWSLPPTGAARLVRKIQESVGGGVYTNLEQAIRGIASLVSSASQDSPPEPSRAQEQNGPSLTSDRTPSRTP
jgi:predicted PurR-regulated permease PerM